MCCCLYSNKKSCGVISKEESANFDFADFKIQLSHHDEKHHFAVNNMTDSINSNGGMAEGSRYNLNVNASSNLDDVAATANATADVFDNAKYQSSAVVVLKTTPVVISTETVWNCTGNSWWSCTCWFV